MPRSPQTLFALKSILTLAVACSGITRSEPDSQPAGAWDLNNDPVRMDWDSITRFDALPLKGSLLEGPGARYPWVDAYWPKDDGGIAYRWNARHKRRFEADGEAQDLAGTAYGLPPTLEQLRTMSASEIAQLSPAEKFDIFVGDYSYKTVEFMRKSTSPTDERWEGYCHGWANAALLFDEPRAVVIENDDGIRVPFGSSDVKALLTFYAKDAQYMDTGVNLVRDRQSGMKCELEPSTGNEPNGPACADVNAGAFHIALANILGLKKKGIVADVTRDSQMWNQPVHSFESKVLAMDPPSDEAAPGTMKEILVQTVMRYSMEVGAHWDLPGRNDAEKTYLYKLEINANGEIQGGRWLRKDARFPNVVVDPRNDRPDVLWFTEKAPPFSGRFAKLETLYEASIRQSTPVPNPANNGGH